MDNKAIYQKMYIIVILELTSNSSSRIKLKKTQIISFKCF